MSSTNTEFDDALEALTEIALDRARTATMVEIGRLKAKAEAAHEAAVAEASSEAYTLLGRERDSHQRTINELAALRARIGATLSLRSLQTAIADVRELKELVRATKAEIESLKAKVASSVVLADDLAGREVRHLGHVAGEIRHLQATVHQLAQQKGWWHDYIRTTDGKLELTTRDVLSHLALIHSEVSEAAEDVRLAPPYELHQQRLEDGKPCGFPSELADVVIRVLDLGEALGVDVGKAVVDKHAYNCTRPLRHGGKLA